MLQWQVTDRCYRCKECFCWVGHLHVVSQVLVWCTPHLKSHHTTGHAGCNLWKGAFSFLQEAGKKKKKERKIIVIIGERRVGGFCRLVSKQEWKRLSLPLDLMLMQSNAEQAPLKDNKGHHIILVHITNENECKKNVLIKEEKSFLLSPHSVISLLCASPHLNILLHFPSLPSFSCCPKPRTMHLKGEMSHASKLLSGLGC